VATLEYTPPGAERELPRVDVWHTQDSMQHQWFIDQREYERHQARRGRRHAYERIEPLRAALVVVDMIPFFVESNPYARGIVPVIDSLARTVRNTGGTVAWTVPGAPSPDDRAEFFGVEVAQVYAASGGSGPITERLWPELDPDAGDLFVEKTAPSAFFPDRCPLPTLLDERGVDTVLITGTVANVCCESSARDASTLGYRVVFVADGNAAARDADLNATLHTIYRSFGDVRSASEVGDLLTSTGSH